MLTPGLALKVIIHLNVDVSSTKDYLHSQLLSFLFESNVAGASVFRPEAGFGFQHRLHSRGTAGDEGRHLPVQIEFIDNREKVDALMPALLRLVTDGMVEVQETKVLQVIHNRSGERH